MRYTAYYIIRSNPALAMKVAGTEYADLEALVGPLLWTHEQGGRSSFSKQDHVFAIKRLYVEYVRNVVFASTAKPAIYMFDLSVGEESFDQWWTLEVFDSYHNTTAEIFDELQEIIGPDEVAHISPVFNKSGS